MTSGTQPGLLTPEVIEDTVDVIRVAHKSGLRSMLRTVAAAIAAHRSPNVELLTTTVSAEYAPVEVQAIADKLDILILALISGGIMNPDPAAPPPQ
jgi:hypothetical protein